MPSLRSAWNPITPLGVVVLASLGALAAPAEQRPGWLGLVLLLLSPVAAFVASRALRGALARAAPLGPGAGSAPRQERVLGLALRGLLVLVAALVPLAALVTDLGVRSGKLGRGETALTLALPLLFSLLGAQLWRDLCAARRQRAAGGPPARAQRPSFTGVAAWVMGFTSAAAWIADQVVRGQPIVAQLMKVDERVAAGEVWRIFTATAVHGSLAGLVLNGAAFFGVAPLLELLLGAPRLVFVFVVGGVAATSASFAAAAGPFTGASGAVAAVAGALLAFGVRRRQALPAETRRRIVLHGGVALVAVALAAGLLPDVDLAAVGGGLAFGAVAGLAFEPPEDARAALAAVAGGAR
jgi:membrane associated rhomboid family serine protease